MAESSGNLNVGSSTNQPIEPSSYPAGASPVSILNPSVSKPNFIVSRSVTHSPGVVPTISVAGSRETSSSKLSTSLAESRS